MLSTAKAASALLVLLLDLVSAHDGSSRSRHFPGKQLVFGRDSFENTTLSYATCDLAEGQSEKRCTVVREDDALNGTLRAVSCEVTLKAEKAERLIGPRMKVVPLGLDRAIFIWTESDRKESRSRETTLVRYTTVKYPECRSTEAKLSYARKDDEVNPDSYLERVRMATYSDSTYCLVFSNDSLCGGKNVCKLHVDPEAGETEAPDKWFTPESGLVEVVPLAQHSQEKGHLVVEGTFVNVPQAYVVKRDGQIMKFPSELDAQRSWKLVHSTAHSTIGLCYHSNSSFSCARYDHEGQPKLRSNPDFGYDVEQAAMHNLRDGGFLLLTSRCESICAMNDDHYYVTKFDAQGRKAGEVHLTGFHRERLSNLVNAQLFEKDDKLYCVSMARYSISPTAESPDLLTFANCFDDKSFK
ncbi:uncharacterized protein LOC131667120 [Phymastichus coffea]|uniref:uncharacterized protein LOC131667120 n=1 Tax=Phymastichus coffea TaxID=108790 RepID=UPI00273B8665|nr:uncharacterized protein LOC131667120 [Phymastichus coffea]